MAAAFVSLILNYRLLPSPIPEHPRPTAPSATRGHGEKEEKRETGNEVESDGRQWTGGGGVVEEGGGHGIPGPGLPLLPMAGRELLSHGRARRRRIVSSDPSELRQLSHGGQAPYRHPFRRHQHQRPAPPPYVAIGGTSSLLSLFSSYPFTWESRITCSYGRCRFPEALLVFQHFFGGANVF